MIKFVSIAIILTFSIIGNTSMSKQALQSSSNIIAISDIFNNDVLIGCRFRTPFFIDLYMSNNKSEGKRLVGDVLYIDNSKRVNLKPSITTGTKTLKVSGIKAMKNFERKTSDYNEFVWSVDIDVHKDDIHILRFAKFETDDLVRELEYSGYYYIIKGLPNINIAKLKSLNKNKELENIKIEKTESDNTRVRCIF